MEVIFEEGKILTEETRTELKKVINEELSINNEVEMLTHKIYYSFFTNFNKINFSKIENGVSLGILLFKNVNIFGENYTVRFNCYNTNDKDIYSQMIKRYHCYNANTELNNKSITVNIGLFSGTKYKKFEGLLQHEIEHVFQYTKRGKLNTYGRQSGGLKMYNKALEILNNSDKHTKEEYKCAFLVYFLSESEIDAFVNQLYGDLIEGDAFNEENIIAKSSAMEYYETSKKYLKEIDINNLFYKMALMSFGLDTVQKQQWFIKYCNKAIKRCINKIGKVVVKARKDNDKEIAIQLNDLNDNVRYGK